MKLTKSERERISQLERDQVMMLKHSELLQEDLGDEVQTRLSNKLGVWWLCVLATALFLAMLIVAGIDGQIASAEAEACLNMVEQGLWPEEACGE